jgi:hypothetical protein
MKPVRADRLEARVWQYILDLWSNKRRFERALRLAKKSAEDAAQPLRDRYELVLTMLAECEVEATKLAEAIRQTPKGGIVARALQSQVDEVEKRYSALCRERDELTASLQQEGLTEAEIQNQLRFREDVRKGMHNPTFEDKRRNLELLRVQVSVSTGRARVRCIVPRSARSFDLPSSTST